MEPQRFPIGAFVRVVDLDLYEGTVVACEWRESVKSYVYTVMHPFIGAGSDAVQTLKRYWSEKALTPCTPVLCDKHGGEKVWDHRFLPGQTLKEWRATPRTRCCPTCEREAK